MSLQFIFGPSGSGKSHSLYQYIVEDSISHPQQNYVVLVPEQFTMQTQKDLVTAHPRRGISRLKLWEACLPCIRGDWRRHASCAG